LLGNEETVLQRGEKKSLIKFPVNADFYVIRLLLRI
jgi:hypothetical protein